MRRILFVFLALTVPAAMYADGGDREDEGTAIIAKYQESLRNQQDATRGLSMDVLMDGKIPRLKKEGKLSALRKISKVGGITYRVLNFWGDDTVKKEVMARYMTAEVQAATQAAMGTQKEGENIGITPENYEFKYKGLQQKNDRQVHIFELKPRHKRVGLFKGELWLDPESNLPVRESGRLVKNPSIFIKKMEFVREYDVANGVSLLKRMETKTDTRVVGRAELNIEYANVRRESEEEEASVSQ